MSSKQPEQSTDNSASQKSSSLWKVDTLNCIPPQTLTTRPIVTKMLSFAAAAAMSTCAASVAARLRLLLLLLYDDDDDDDRHVRDIVISLPPRLYELLRRAVPPQTRRPPTHDLHTTASTALNSTEHTCGPTLQTDQIRPSSIFCCGSHSVEQSNSCRIQTPDNQRCLLPTAFKDSSVRTTASAP